MTGWQAGFCHQHGTVLAPKSPLGKWTPNFLGHWNIVFFLFMYYMLWLFYKTHTSLGFFCRHWRNVFCDQIYIYLSSFSFLFLVIIIFGAFMTSDPHVYQNLVGKDFVFKTSWDHISIHMFGLLLQGNIEHLMLSISCIELKIWI